MLPIKKCGTFAGRTEAEPVVSVAGGASEGVSAAARAGTHIAHQLYTSGLGAMAEAGAVGKEVGTELGSSEFGQALKRAWRPARQLQESFEEIHQFHQGMVRTLSDAINSSKSYYRRRFEQALTGESGDALLAAHDAAVKTWCTHEDMHAAAAEAASRALGHIKGLQGRIDNLAEAGEEEFNTAIRNRDPLAAMNVWTRYNELAETSTSEATKKATSAIRAANFTIPLDVTNSPTGKDGKRTGDDPSKYDDDGQPKPDAKRSGPDASGTAPGDVPSDGSRQGDATNQPYGTKTDGPPGGAEPATSMANAGRTDGSSVPQTGQTPPMTQTLSGAAGGGQGGGSGGGGGGPSMSGLGSAFKPPASMGSLMPTSPASSMPSAPPAPSSSAAASPMSNAGSSFQSGLASGMSATGGGNALSNLGSPVSQQSVTQQGLPTQQVGGAPAFGSGSAGVPLSVPGGDAGFGSSSGSSSGGGTQMMPPPAMGGAAPLAPYSAPGAGAASAAGAGSASTAPTAAGPSSGSTGGGPAPGPLVAGGAGSSVSAPGVAALGEEVNPDLLLAQRVLGGLVRGCERWPAPIAWAVSVVKTPVGSQVLVASSLGGGSYLPATVFLPATARLAVVDPALPFGWAHGWMGCQKPSKILADHFEHFRKRVAGASISAMVTTELRPDRPAGVADFAGFQHIDALYLVPAAPSLDGAHQHRLTALDPVLAQRVSSIGSIDGHVSAYAAAQLTAAVMQAAGQPDPTGEPLATADEGNILASVQRGTANDMSWKLYDELAYRRYGSDLLSPDSCAPRDYDGSELYHESVVRYRHFYHVGRVIELVQLWRSGSVPPLAEIAYCGVQAGFGSVVAAMVSAIEQQIQQFRGRTA
ncbi:hypothetical protein LAUMK40_05761 [Mycobacterium kansasii]|nr:hypothetical protein LAUMK40_05761 [Mycobacterium kansasii]